MIRNPRGTIRLAHRHFSRNHARRAYVNQSPTERALLDARARAFEFRRMIQRTLKVSPEGASYLLKQLGPALREVTGQRSYRVWGI
jgi:hypothetical protein